MELVHAQPEVFMYRHKKFDQRQRIKATEMPLAPNAASTALKHKLEQCDALTISSDSNSSCDFVSFTHNFQQNSSTPLAKRRKLLPQLAIRQQSSCEDSGIVLTPQKRHIDDSSSLASSWGMACRTPTPNGARSLLVTALASPTVAATPATVASSSSTAALPQISTETLRSICKYHGNMVRKFPKKERTPKDQERRNKNTIACRMSRRVKKLEHITIEEQYKQFSQQHMQIVTESLCAAAYLQELIKLAAVVEERDMQRPSLPFDEQPSTSKRPDELEQKKCFSIAYLMSSETK